MIEELYAASREGVPIGLIVRSISCLRPKMPEKSETIRVGSIVGRFLEHSRVYRFINGGNEEIYIGSADLMTRNLDRRVEVLFPIEDEKIKERIVREVLEPAFSDNMKMRWLQMDGTYMRLRNSDEKPFNSQETLLEPALIG
jgi:polyphosphate kinase